MEDIKTRTLKAGACTHFTVHHILAAERNQMVQDLMINQDNDANHVGTEMIGHQMSFTQPLELTTKEHSFSLDSNSSSSSSSSISTASSESDEIMSFIGLSARQSGDENLHTLLATSRTTNNNSPMGPKQETIDKEYRPRRHSNDIQPKLSLMTANWWYNLPPALQQMEADETGSVEQTGGQFGLGYPFTPTNCTTANEEIYRMPRKTTSPEIVSQDYTDIDSSLSHNDSSRRWSFGPRCWSLDSNETDISFVTGDDIMKQQSESSLKDEVGPESIETDSDDWNKCRREPLLSDSLSMLLPHNLHSALYSSIQMEGGNLTGGNREACNEILDTDQDAQGATDQLRKQDEKAARHLDANNPMRRAPKNDTWQVPVHSCWNARTRNEHETNAVIGACDRRARTLLFSYYCHASNPDFKSMCRAPQGSFMTRSLSCGNIPRSRCEIEPNEAAFVRKRTLSFADFCASKKASDATRNTVDETALALSVDTPIQPVDEDDVILPPV